MANTPKKILVTNDYENYRIDRFLIKFLSLPKSLIHKDLRKLIEYLPEDQKEVLKMRYYAELSFKEISESTGVSINTALGRMRYALINLRKLIDSNQVDLQVS